VAREPARLEIVIEGIRARKRAFEDALRPLRAKALADKAGVRGRPTSLDRAVRLGVPILAAGALEQIGIQVAEAELEPLLAACPAVFAYAAVHAAYVQAQAIVGRAPHLGDSYALLHAVSASAVDEFVSEDRYLRDLVSIGSRRRDSCCSLREFVATLS
jgi:hypothetical protein